jgi:L-asparaginase II
MAAWWEFMRRGTLPGLWGILSAAGLSEDVLQTPPDYPLGEKSRIDQIVSGVGKTALAMNCSGKRAAMLP